MSSPSDSVSVRHRGDQASSPFNGGARFDIPCTRSPHLSAIFGADIAICDATMGPTSTWKDCVAPGVVAAARRQGIRRVVVASSGNHGRAIAYACRQAGFKTAVLVYDRTPPDVETSLIALGAEVFHFPDRVTVHKAMERFIADGWFSATLPDRLRTCSSMPGGEGYRQIALSIASAVDGNPIVVVPTCYGDGATSVRHHLAQLGRRPNMCLVRASDATGAAAASIATDVLTPQVSHLLASGAVDVVVENRSFFMGRDIMEAAVGKPLDLAEGGIPPALKKLVAGGAGSLCKTIVCVVTGRVFPGLQHVSRPS